MRNLSHWVVVFLGFFLFSAALLVVPRVRLVYFHVFRRLFRLPSLGISVFILLGSLLVLLGFLLPDVLLVLLFLRLCVDLADLALLKGDKGAEAVGGGYDENGAVRRPREVGQTDVVDLGDAGEWLRLEKRALVSKLFFLAAAH